MSERPRGNTSAGAATAAVVHMDVDTGVDDALAILMALGLPGVRLDGISTAAGNTSARQAALNTRLVLDVLGTNVPVYVGREQAFDGGPVEPVPSVHGEDGLGGVSPAYWQRRGGRLPDLANGAPEAIVRAAREYGPRLHLLATAPVTNVARALELDLTAMSRIGRLVVMGGSFDEGGNITPFAEFNAHADPAALRRVLAAGLPTTLIPLDVTHRVKLMRADLDAATFLDPGLHQFLREMTDVYMRFHRGEADRFDGSYMHDALTVAAVVRPDLFTFCHGAVDVEVAGPRGGRTSWARAGTGARSAIDVATAVNAMGCLDLFWSAVRHLRARWPTA